jgi:integrase
MFNEAIEAKVILADCYPFGFRRFEIPSSKNTKKALPISDIGKLFKAPSSGNESEERWKAMWFFIYLCNGLNAKDVCMLKYKNLVRDKIIIIREKTKTTKRKSVQRIEIIITKEIRKIINKWGVKPEDEDKYIFPILTPNMSAVERKQAIHQTIKQINKYMRRIAERVGISQDIKTMEARHSFATILKNSGASIEFISESMGHGSIKTTQDYLGSFEDDKKKEFANKLLDFGKPKPQRNVKK